MKHCKYVDDWISAVEKGKVHSCREQKKLVKLLKTILTDDIYFDNEAIENYIELTEKYFFPLYPAQKFIAALVIGCRYKKTNLLVFPILFLMMGRGGGKNGFISSLAFYLISDFNGIENYNVDIVANSEEQAKVSFNEVYQVFKKMGSKGKRLCDYNLTEITYKKTMATLKYRTSNPKTKDGGRPGCVIFDEIHAYESTDNIKVFRGGLGKVPDARQIYITTDGELRDGVLDNYKERARQILDGERDFGGFLPIIFKLDSIQEMGKKDLWDKANPRIDYSLDLKRQIELEYEETFFNENDKVAFLTKRMNIVYSNKDKAVASVEDILATKDRAFPDFENCECIGAIDFADLIDFASVGLRFKRDGINYFKQHTFIHETSLETTSYNVDIMEAVRRGEATVVPKALYPTIPPDLLAEWFMEQAEKYYIKSIHCDSFRYTAIKESFERAGLNNVKLVRNGSISHNLIAPQILQMFKERTLTLEDDRLMRWYISNVMVVTDKKGNKTFQKIEPIKRKTDGFFCLLHSLLEDDLNDVGELQELLDVAIF